MDTLWIVLGSVAGFVVLCFCLFLIIIRPATGTREIMKRYT